MRGIDTKVGLRLDVPTRWNSTYVMLESALRYHRAFASFTIRDKFSFFFLHKSLTWRNKCEVPTLLPPITYCLLPTCKINYFNFYFLDFPIKCYNSVLYLHLLIENTRLGTYWKHEFKSWYSNAMSQKAWGPLSHMVDPKGWIRFQRYPSKRT